MRDGRSGRCADGLDASIGKGGYRCALERVCRKYGVSDLIRNFGQRVALFSGIVCAALALPASAGFIWVWRERGGADPWVPSMAAIVFFLLSCAVVLYVMSRPRPPLSPHDDAGPQA